MYMQRNLLFSVCLFVYIKPGRVPNKGHLKTVKRLGSHCGVFLRAKGEKILNSLMGTYRVWTWVLLVCLL